MARGINLLTARTVAALTEPGRYSDGGGLYLLVRKRSQSTERLWLFRYRRGGRDKTREVTLSIGPVRDVSLAAARGVAGRCREALAAGRDPREEIARNDSNLTFGQVADDLIETITPSFKNAKHVAQWKMTMGDDYCRALRRIPVNKITTEDVLAVLKPIWLAKPETASRIRGRIERVIDSATARRLRSGDNPARWKGHLAHLLSSQDKLVRGHHKALAWHDVPSFMRRLRALNSVSAAALEWTILTASRTSETTGAALSEIDKEARVWTVPAERMKAGREHRVPLTDRCMEIVAEMESMNSDWLFPGPTLKAHLSNSAMAECLKGLNDEVTVHGFRSSFRDWVGEATSFPETLAEAALAHVIGDKTERAYRRGDALERRRELMTAWERYCGGVSNVVSLAETNAVHASAP